ncbi:protein At-4/1 [Olea europaea var. sylvestris]|uniref:protein At-4/1 n=1 Tax=Olea europaea var. sylvestris TaxID=158386 RepID=UPI000C1D704D|nr:protein At-4/1 [Olea europaea var. sylvestris]XP_022842821.1 protein At-4/1 [Olea europaea var. sylvestris]
MKRREALESTVHFLQSENERLTERYTESLHKFAAQIELRTNYRSLKEDFKRVTDELSQKEIEYKNAVEWLKQDHMTKIADLESQIRGFQMQKVANEAAASQLHQDLAVHKNHIDMLTRRLEQVCSEVESRYCYEIQGLKDLLLIEQEEKNELNKKFPDLEKELFMSQSKLAELQRDSTSNQHMETLKQKIMKLRKENEVLKRKLADSKES